MSDTLYEFYLGPYNSVSIFYGTLWLSQTFTLGAVGLNQEHNITSVKLLLYRLGSPGTVTVSIRNTDIGGFPTGADLTSGTTNGDTLTTVNTGEWREITVTPYKLLASTKYAIVVNAAGGDALNAGKWRMKTAAGYTGGCGAYSNTSGLLWDLYATYDYLFYEYGIPTEIIPTFKGGIARKIGMPTPINIGVGM